jgi:uncharacterized membrane protein
METANPGLTLTEERFIADRSASVDGSVRVVMIIGFLAVLALEAYLIWEGLSLL